MNNTWGSDDDSDDGKVVHAEKAETSNTSTEVGKEELTIDNSSKRKGELPIAGSKKFKKATLQMFDLEADESGDEKAASDADSEDNENYQYDTFLVRDGVGENKKGAKITQKKQFSRLKKQRDKITLDEDDLELIQESYKVDNEQEIDPVNTGYDGNDGDNSEGEDEDQNDGASRSASGKHLEDILDDAGDEDDDMNGFVVNDLEDGDENDENREALRNFRKQSNAATSRLRAPRDGPTQDQLEDCREIFGTDFDDLDDEPEEGREDDDNDIDEEDEEDLGEIDEEENATQGRKQGKQTNNAKQRHYEKLKSSFDRSQLVSTFCTTHDDVLRRVDRPERYQDVLEGRNALQDDERKDEAGWIAVQLAEKIFWDHQAKTGTQLNIEPYEEAFIAPIEHVLKFIQVENLEVPFIWTYRRDYLHPDMTRQHLWWIYEFDFLWEANYVMRRNITQTVISITDASHGTSANYAQEQKELLGRVQECSRRCQSLQRDLADAEKEERDAMDLVDEAEDNGQESEEARQRVEAASQNKKSLQLQVKQARLELVDRKKEEKEAKERFILQSKYKPEAAAEVLKLFPSERYSAIITESRDATEMRDILGFLEVLLKGALADSVSVGNDAADDIGKLTLKKSRVITGRDKYLRLRKVPRLREFVEMVCAPICDIGDGVRMGYQATHPPAPERRCDQVALDYVDATVLRDEQAVIDAATLIIATELCAEPAIKRSAREMYLAGASISTRPTHKGLTAITPFSELFGLHYLDRKPISDLKYGKNRHLYVRLLEAQTHGLLTVTINPPLQEINGAFVACDFLAPLFIHLLKSNSLAQDELNPHVKKSWDDMRIGIMQCCTHKIMLPLLEAELRRELIRAGREAIVEEASDKFASMLAVGPYRPKSDDAEKDMKELLLSCPRKPFYASVMSIYISDYKEPVYLSYVDKHGALRAHDIIPDKIMNQKRQKIKDFMMENKPELIVINSSGGFNSRSTAILIEKELILEVQDALASQRKSTHQRTHGYGQYGDEDDEDDENIPLFKAHVCIVKDDVAIVFKNSPRAKKMFPEFDSRLSAAVCLARYAQEPLAEFCNMWDAADATETFGHEVLFLDLHPNQSMLKGVKGPLLAALERRLVDAVCEVGVNLHAAVSYDHMACMLAFVSGLGLRKADALRQNIRRLSTPVESRKDLLVGHVLGLVVWTNSIGFLRIRPNEDDIEVDDDIDLLEDTRIHPECYMTYDFAPKICAYAMEMDHKPKDYVETVSRLVVCVRKELQQKLVKCPNWIKLWLNGTRPTAKKYLETVRQMDGRVVERELPTELTDCLQQLELEDYAADVEKSGKGLRMLQLEHIKEELRYPWLDLRKPMQPPQPSEMFTMLTGETNYSLHIGMKIGCTVISVEDKSYNDPATGRSKRSQKVNVRTDSNMKGTISAYDVIDGAINENVFNLADVLPPNTHVVAVVLNVNKFKCMVDLSLKPSLLARSEADWLADRHEDKDTGTRDNWWKSSGRDPDNLFDSAFNEVAALQEFRSAEKASIAAAAALLPAQPVATAVNRSGRQAGDSSTTKKTSGQARHIIHPSFQNCNYREAEDRLRKEGHGAGEIIIRPSSKGPNYLTITWAFQENRYKHIEIEEKGKTLDSLGIGKELYISETDLTEFYSDLDEICARYIDPMNDFVAIMIQHRRFRDGTPAEVEDQMMEELARDPATIPYYIRFDVKEAGMFILTWMLKGSSKPHIMPIKVRPYGLKINGETYRRPDDLISYFKKMVQSAHRSAQATKQAAGASLSVTTGSISTASVSSARASRPSRFDRPAPAMSSESGGYPPPPPLGMVMAHAGVPMGHMGAPYQQQTGGPPQVYGYAPPPPPHASMLMMQPQQQMLHMQQQQQGMPMNMNMGYQMQQPMPPGRQY